MMAEKIRLGTYNTNNLFDRFNDPYNFSDDPWRHYFATKPKKLEDLYHLGSRIRSSSVDILALQEIESLGALKEFMVGHVGDYYKSNGIISLESNDPRGIDLGAACNFPLGRVVSHRFRTYTGSKKVFSRDCLQVEILKSDSSETLLTLFICHLKSKYSSHAIGTPEYDQDQQASNTKRERQVLHTIEIIQDCQDIDQDRFVVLGDFNDTPDSSALNDFLDLNNPLKLTNPLNSIPQDDTSPNSTVRRPRDTHKWSKDPEHGHPNTTYSQLDYILLSQALTPFFTGEAKVEQSRYTQGSDHYLCWVEFDIEGI
jgi:endonuclease/exonuclease/phosphatase family metal-dependent hydrolase